MGAAGSTPLTDGHNNNTASIASAERAGFIIFVFGDRKCLVVRPNDYQSALNTARNEFQIPQSTKLCLKIEFRGQCVEIGDRAYNKLGDRISEIYIDYAIPLAPAISMNSEGQMRSHETVPRRKKNKDQGTLSVIVKTLTGTTVNVNVPFPLTVESLKGEFSRLEGVPVDQQRMIYGGRQMEDGRYLSDYGVTSDSLIHFVLRLRGDKPVIYIQTPIHLDDVHVQLSLCPQWAFSALYPPVKPTVADGQSNVEWRVSADPSGNLIDLSSQLEVSYLFWEALSHPSRPPTPPRDEVLAAAFDPANPSLIPSNAAVLSFEPLLVHLDRALTTLGLHVSGRTDFMTYWLSHFTRIHERGDEIAFRFLAQDDFAQAARLDVTPKPDVVTRVFMLFGGVRRSDTSWAESRQRAEGVNWQTVVGVHEDAFDEAKYRVLEWGGMDVSHIVARA